MRVLITGGSGFIGTNLVAHMRALGHEVLNADKLRPRDETHAALWHPVDITDRAALITCVRDFGPELVFHLAARTDLDGADVSEYAANMAGVSHLIDALQLAPEVQRVVFASSRLVCRIGHQPAHDEDYCPTTPYGQSKVEGERIVRARCAAAPYSWVILRPTSIWGPWFDVPYKLFFLSVAAGRYVHPRGVRIPKSFGFVGNTVHELEAVGRVAASQVQGRTLYLADYPPIEVLDLAHEVQRASGARPVREVPLAVLRTGARLGDTMKSMGMRNPPLTSFRLANLMSPMVHDLAPLQQLCGPLPHGLRDGVEQTVAWLRSRREVT